MVGRPYLADTLATNAARSMRFVGIVYSIEVARAPSGVAVVPDLNLLALRSASTREHGDLGFIHLTRDAFDDASGHHRRPGALRRIGGLGREASRLQRSPRLLRRHPELYACDVECADRRPARAARQETIDQLRGRRVGTRLRATGAAELKAKMSMAPCATVEDNFMVEFLPWPTPRAGSINREYAGVQRAIGRQPSLCSSNGIVASFGSAMRACSHPVA